jgi:hypothetical protein
MAFTAAAILALDTGSGFLVGWGGAAVAAAGARLAGPAAAARDAVAARVRARLGLPPVRPAQTSVGAPAVLRAAGYSKLSDEVPAP